MILDAAETQAPGLRDLARRVLEAEARHPGVPRDAASVIGRRAEAVPEMHITGAADRLLEHLAAAEPASPTTRARSWPLHRSGRSR